MKFYLNSKVYPYDNLNLNFAQKQSVLLYEMFVNFQTSYYYKDLAKPCVGPVEFRKKLIALVKLKPSKLGPLTLDLNLKPTRMYLCLQQLFASF